MKKLLLLLPLLLCCGCDDKEDNYNNLESSINEIASKVEEIDLKQRQPNCPYDVEVAIKRWLLRQSFEVEPYQIINWTITECEFYDYGYTYYSLDIYYTTGEVKVKHLFFAYDTKLEEIVQIVEVK